GVEAAAGLPERPVAEEREHVLLRASVDARALPRVETLVEIPPHEEVRVHALAGVVGEPARTGPDRARGPVVLAPSAEPERLVLEEQPRPDARIGLAEGRL